MLINDFMAVRIILTVVKSLLVVKNHLCTVSIEIAAAPLQTTAKCEQTK